MPPSSSPSPLSALLVGFGIFAFMLLAALGYNLGGSAVEDRTAIEVRTITRRLELDRERVALCTADLQAHKDGRATAVTEKARLEREIETLHEHERLGDAQLAAKAEALKECHDEIANDRVDHQGTPEHNASAVLLRLQYESHAIVSEMEDCKDLANVSTRDIARKIKAYRREMRELEALVDKKRATAKDKAAQAKAAGETDGGAPASPPPGEDEQGVVLTTNKTTGKPMVDCSKQHLQFAVMFDAGSSGTRVHAFRFRRPTKQRPFSGSAEETIITSRKQLTLEDELFETTNKALSKQETPEDAADVIAPLMKKTLAYVPSKLRKCTPLGLKATAGLRQQGQERADKILAAVRERLSSYQFPLSGERAVEIMPGRDEAAFSWLTINYLLGKFPPTAPESRWTVSARAADGAAAAGTGKARFATAAALDMGGGSTQITFRLPTVTAGGELKGNLGLPDDEASAVKEYKEYYNLTALGFTVKLYVHSHERYGLNSGVQRMFENAKAEDAKATGFSCLASGTSAFNVSNTAGEHSFAQCLLEAEHVLNKHEPCEKPPCTFNKAHQPVRLPHLPGPLYAFSFYYDRLEDFLPKTGAASVQMLKDVGTAVCGGSDEEQYRAIAKEPLRCAQYAYLYAVLRGYELEDQHPIVVRKKINKVETAWCLGAALATL